MNAVHQRLRGGRGATLLVSKKPSPRLHAHRTNPESRPDVHAVVICRPTNAPSFGAELESYITRALITPPHGAGGGDRPSPAPRLRSTDTVVVVIPGTAEAVGQHAEVLATNETDAGLQFTAVKAGAWESDRYHFDWVMGALASGWRGVHPCG